MAGSLSDFAELKILDHALSDGSWTEPANIYMALCTVEPTDASTGSTIAEANYTGYTRIEVLATDLSASAAGAKTNSAVLTFPACTAGDDTILGFAICDASTAGNMIMWGSTTSKLIDTSNTPPTIAASGFAVTLT